MGISPIEYSPWSGERTGYLSRISVIIKRVVNDKIRSKGVLALLIIGTVLVHVFPIIFLSLAPHEELTKEMMLGRGFMGAYLTGFLFAVFTLLLAAVVTSNLISQDLSDNSFVIYFSRPIRTWDYLLGKLGGSYIVMSLYCTLPPLALAAAVIATQSGSDYGASLKVLGSTVLAGLFTPLIFIFYGTMLSSFTDRKAFAGIGTFISFFVLTIVGGIFSQFDDNWKLVNPFNILHYTYQLLFGNELPTDINSNLYWGILSAILIIPPLLLYIRVYRKGVGK